MLELEGLEEGCGEERLGDDDSLKFTGEDLFESVFKKSLKNSGSKGSFLESSMDSSNSVDGKSIDGFRRFSIFILLLVSLPFLTSFSINN